METRKLLCMVVLCNLFHSFFPFLCFFFLFLFVRLEKILSDTNYILSVNILLFSLPYLETFLYTFFFSLSGVQTNSPLSSTNSRREVEAISLDSILKGMARTTGVGITDFVMMFSNSASVNSKGLDCHSTASDHSAFPVPSSFSCRSWLAWE